MNHVRLRTINSIWTQLAYRAVVSFRVLRQPIVLCVIGYVLLAMALFSRDYEALFPSNLFYFENFALPATLIGLSLAAVVKNRSSPLSHMKDHVARQGGVILISHVLYVFGLTAYTATKINIPKIIPFYADPWLARIDETIHGTIPWEALYRGPQHLAAAVDFLYSRLWPLEMIGILIAVTLFLRGAPLKRYMWMVLFNYAFIGNFLATLLSSVGPIYYGKFYESDPFANVDKAFFANPYIGNVRLYSEYLLQNFHSNAPAFGTGISSMPSVHVAFATLGAWTLTSFGRGFAVLGWGFAILIELGSIYTGWHYAIDGYVSAFLVSIAWIAISRYYKLPLIPAHPKDKIAPAA